MKSNSMFQLHKQVDEVQLFTKNGHDVTKRFRTVATAGRSLRCDTAILDGELVADDERGRPDFAALHAHRPASKHTLTLWVFDLLHLNGDDLRGLVLDERRRMLARLMKRTLPPIRLSESFDDPSALLKAAIEMGLEGIVSKRRDFAYRSGSRPEWVKVKTAQWRAANRERFKLFAKSR